MNELFNQVNLPRNLRKDTSLNFFLATQEMFLWCRDAIISVTKSETWIFPKMNTLKQ